MDHIFIKEEIEDTHEEGSGSSTSDTYGSKNSTTFTTSTPPSSFSSLPTVSLPPTQRVLPSTLSPSLSVASGLSGGYKYFRPNANENFRYESTSSFNPHGLQKKSPEIHPSRSKHPITQSSLLSPPLLPTGPSFQHHLHSSNLAVVHGHPQDPHVGAGSSIAQDGGFSQEDEWKNIKVVRIKAVIPSGLLTFNFRC